MVNRCVIVGLQNVDHFLRPSVGGRTASPGASATQVPVVTRFHMLFSWRSRAEVPFPTLLGHLRSSGNVFAHWGLFLLLVVLCKPLVLS